MSDTPNEKNFMREKVVKPPIDKRRAAGRILCYVLFAAVFGGVAAVSFVVSLPTAKKLLGKDQPVPTTPITIERDQDPSGNPTPSMDDINATKKIVDAGKVMNIPVLDHIIVGESGNYSMRKEGIVEF